MTTIRVGFVGCGRISQFHLEALKALPVYQVTAVCDEVRERAQAAAVPLGAKVYTSLAEMLSAESLDLVVLATPSGQHPSQAAQCAEAGVACLAEKPFGVHYEEARKTVELFERKGIPLFVVKQNRYNPTVRKVRDWHEAGLLGRLHLVQANVFWQRPQSYYDAAKWRGKRNDDGGAFMNQASHYVDLVQWFGGPVRRVQSQLARLGRQIECEDTGAAVMEFESGAVGVMAVTMLTYPENLEGSLTLLCEKATIRIAGKALNRLEVHRAEAPEIEMFAENVNNEPTTVYGNGHQEYYRRLAVFLKEPRHPEAITGREGLKSLKLLCDIYAERDALS